MAAKLVRVDPHADPGFTRRRAGRGFRYLAPDGSTATDADRRRIELLVIPPAWTDVWIATEASAHIQAVGTDAAGRQQYLYHPRWTAARARRKFVRMLDLAQALPSARARVTRDLRQDDDDRARVLAAAFRLLDDAAPRIGSAAYLARHGSRGLTTLRRKDASVDGTTVTLDFPGKSGVRSILHIEDQDLADVIATLTTGSARSPLLAWRRGRRRVPLTPGDVNGYIRTVAGVRCTAKDFRTLRGTVSAAEALARIGAQTRAKDRRDAVVIAVKATAAQLNNTTAVARSSYIDPRVLTAYEQGRTLDRSIAPETAIRRLLQE